MEDDGSSGRSGKRDETTEPTGAHESPEQRLTVLAGEPAQGGRGVSPVSPQRPHTELDSDSVSDDSDQELDIEDDDDDQFTRRPSL